MRSTPAPFAARSVFSFAVLLLIFSAISSAGPIFYSGSFSNDDDVALISLSFTDPAKLNVRSTSYLAGGFDPLFSLFDSTGALVAIADDQDVAAGLLDFQIRLQLAAGAYTIAISQSPNFPNAQFGGTLADGFLFDGQPTFTAQFGCSNGAFCSGLDGSNRTGDWAFEIQSVPEPGTLALGLVGALGLLTLRRRA